ncbi:threonine/serine exporter family protein [Rothia sp. AR01]|uniref:Threonine/serine exporter family protein n=1 Tax=Rothia santali TaxID=2949643 RepID=A0A9X2HLA7_9MICC|nr:threonine/serine exporter family protein [Rothia santali]MCP3426343.1 threonine/serine exporter family protein [Rothia santali]
MTPPDLSVYRLVFRLGDALIRSGASSATTTKALLAVCTRAGLKHPSVSVTLGQLMVSDQPDDGSPPRTRFHEIEPGALDIRWRTRAEEITEHYLLGDVGLEEALEEIEDQVNQKPSHQWWKLVVGYGVLGTGFGLILGGQPLTAIGGALTSMVISFIFRILGHLGAPGIFGYAAGGFVAVLAATALNTAFSLDQVAVCIVAAIAARLAGIASYGAVQDAITGWYISATGRMMEVATSTAGLVAGVAAGIGAVRLLWGPSVQLIETVEADTTHWTASILGAMFVAAGFTLASGGWAVRLLALTGLGGATELVYLFLLEVGTTPFLSITVSTAITGAACVLISRPINLSSNAIMMVSLMPLFPGMLIYQGLLGSLFGLEDSGATLLEALITAFCLSVGGVLGQYLFSEGLWLARRRQFHHTHPGESFSKVMPEEYNSRDIMLPVFSKPFNGSEARPAGRTPKGRPTADA